MSSDSIPDSLQSSPALQGERVAFTGTLASMTHRQAQELVEKHGGVATPHVSRQTTMLIVGEEGWPLENDGTVSRKLEQVGEWQSQGLLIRVLEESQWLRLLGLEEERREQSGHYTPAMLSQILRVSVSTIRRWHRLGLIRPTRKFGRLPYFDFLEVSAARKAMDLMASGVSPTQLRNALERLAFLLGREQFPQARLELLAENSRLLFRDDTGLLEPSSGQRLFDFDPPESASTAPSDGTVLFPQTQVDSGDHNATAGWTADDWRHAAEIRLESGDANGAIEALRMALMDRPSDPEVHFLLAEALYRTGNVLGARERYHAAVEQDPNDVEAWVQLGCIESELGQPAAAIDAFRIALSVHPEYPDAHWQLAEALHLANKTDEATPHWKRYLEFNQNGPCAEQARQRLSTIERRELT